VLEVICSELTFLEQKATKATKTQRRAKGGGSAWRAKPVAAATANGLACDAALILKID
jgi:hypothetical protein